jgi:hypothetical protein
MNYKFYTVSGLYKNVKAIDVNDTKYDKKTNFFNLMLLISELLNEHNNYAYNLPIFENEDIREMSNMCTKFLNVYSNDEAKSEFVDNWKDWGSYVDGLARYVLLLNLDMEMSLKVMGIFTCYKSIKGKITLFYRITVNYIILIQFRII